jgi:hypothetical protein
MPRPDDDQLPPKLRDTARLLRRCRPATAPGDARVSPDREAGDAEDAASASHGGTRPDGASPLSAA